MPIFLPEMIRLERYYVPILTIRLTSSEWDRLQKILGAEIPRNYRQLVEHALEHLVASYCLKHRAPKLSELEERVREINNASERLLKMSRTEPVDIVGKQKSKQKSISRGTARHVMSANQTVNQYLIHTLPTKGRSLQEYLEPVRVLAEICEQGLEQIEKRASKRGAKVDMGLEYLVIVLVFVACRVTKRTDFELPSVTTKTYNSSDYPLLAFVREAITIGAEKGIQAIAGKKELTPDEVRVASNLLNALRRGSQRSSILSWSHGRLSFEKNKPR